MRHERYDPWGVGEALQMGLRMFIHAQRATGRSTMLLDSLRDGDIIIAATEREARRLERLAHERGLKHVISMGYEPRAGELLVGGLINRLQGSKRRVVFDHTFFEAVYFNMLHDIQSALAQVVSHNHTENKAEVLDEAAQREAMLETARAMGADDYLLGGPER